MAGKEGRPRKPDEEKLLHPIHLYFTEADIDRIHKFAESTYDRPSNAVRRAVLNAVDAWERQNEVKTVEVKPV